ncbi:CapA family protein [Jiangella alkaliphila]|uniref:CapA family protein n=1 Tax=Jiangella alkaliphila TaxID=419479 RepID=UPI00069AADDC|nr:CapA family protein [Jiangella alkaliphila]
MLGDMMLGGQVGERLAAGQRVFSDDIASLLAGADLVVANLECCITTSTQRWPSPSKRFYFRAPPAAADALAELGVDCVTLANNHSMDYGEVGLSETIDRLTRVGIDVVGAGADVMRARAPSVVEVNGVRVGVMGVTDHPPEWAATRTSPGVAFARLSAGVPEWLQTRIETLAQACDVVLLSPHWGPNLARTPAPYVRRAAQEFIDAGATLVAGHSAHLCHGTADRVIFDLGDFVNDYEPHPLVRMDLGAVWLVDLDPSGRPARARVFPTVCRAGQVTLASGADRARFAEGLVAETLEIELPDIGRGGDPADHARIAQLNVGDRSALR